MTLDHGCDVRPRTSSAVDARRCPVQRLPQDEFQQGAELVELMLAEAGEGAFEYRGDPPVALPADLVAPLGHPVPDRPSRCGYALDEAAIDHPRGERAERPVGLECQLRQLVQ